AALAAANVGAVVHAMHDPTEGGLAMGLFELVGPAGLGLRVIREHIPVFPETDTICGALALDPLKLIASGALLIAVAPDRPDSVENRVRHAGFRRGAHGRGSLRGGWQSDSHAGSISSGLEIKRATR